MRLVEAKVGNEAVSAHSPTLRGLFLRPSVALVAAAGIAVRVWILLSPLGVLNADEAYTGLQAADIMRGHFPVVIGGASYTGTLDTYALAPIVWLTGQHVVTLKLMSPVLWAIAAVLAVGAARRIARDGAALLCGALVWLTPGALAVISTRSYVAYGLGLTLVTAVLWSALALVEGQKPSIVGSALFGGLAGLAFYTHPMFVAVVGPVAVVVALRHRRCAREFWLPAVATAVVVNLPFLVWNLTNSWASLDQPPLATKTTYMQRLRGLFVGLLPRDLGVRRQSGEWVFGRAVAVLVVLVALAVIAYGSWRILSAKRWSGAVLTAPLVLAWPLLACLNNLADVRDGRYGVIVFPVLALCLAAGADGLLERAPRPSLGLVAAGWLAVCSVPFVYQEAGTDLGDPNRSTQILIDTLEAEGFDRVAGYYWAVLPIEYASDARIRGGIAGNPPVIRLEHTQALVEATPPEQLAYVFLPEPVDSSWVKLPLERYRTIAVAGYVLYLPT